MAPKSAISDTVYVVSAFVATDDEDTGGLRQTEVYTTLAAANTAAKSMLDRIMEEFNPPGDEGNWFFNQGEDSDGLHDWELDHPTDPTTAKVRVWKSVVQSGAAQKPKPGTADEKKTNKKTIKNEDDDEDDDQDEEEAPEVKPRPVKKKAAAPPKTAINAKTHRKTIPIGQRNCLAGLKLLFTGTFETMDRKTSVATAITYGAEVITKLEDTDYIVIGTRAGPKKLQEINEKELETISEEEFFDILVNGVPQEKRERMRNRRLAEDNERPEGEDDEDEEERRPKKRPAAKGNASAAKKAKR
ncbi:hypothetical protein BX600DRAFT_444879 [Xylariales sp. PMI_506]|nr:hypothetical protein BX600DRAFT_444879 [Xylariales sp. PMI_506]